MAAKQIITTLLIVLDCVLGLTIIVVVLFQGGKIRGIGNAIAGTSDSSLFETHKDNYTKNFSVMLTSKLGIGFVVLTFAITILVSKHVLSI